MKHHLAPLLLALSLPAAAIASPAAQAQPGVPAHAADVLAEYGLPADSHADPAAYFRELGIEAQLEGRYPRAHDHFLRAARLSDKLSQAAIAEQYWQGQGMDADRVLGYVWMDLAAERGTPAFVALREHYWQALSAEERARVSAVGPGLHAVYGDPAALRRVAQEQRRAKYRIVGSRVGWDSNVDVCIGARQDAYDGCVTSVPSEAARKP